MAKTPRELLDLPENWNTYKSRKITEAAVRTAEAIQYVPTSPGGIQIELHAGGMEIEIEIDEQGRIETVLTAPRWKGQN